MASFDINNLINNFSELSLTNNNNFDDEVNEFMNIDIDCPEKFRYPNAIIYGFKLNGDDENNFFYIGSSVNPYTRFKQHISDSNGRRKNKELYEYIKIVGWFGVEKYLIEKFPCNDKEKELTTREQFFIDIFNPKFNTATAKININDHNYYHNSFIYKFINKINNELLYIGSTNLDIMSRVGNHKYDIRHPEKDEDNKQLHYILKDIKIENIGFFVMNKIECENDEELHEIENQ